VVNLEYLRPQTRLFGISVQSFGILVKYFLPFGKTIHNMAAAAGSDSAGCGQNSFNRANRLELLGSQPVRG
jgi:hypothetical protein